MIRINLAPRSHKRRRRGSRLALLRPSLGFLFVVAALALGGGIGWGWWHLTQEEGRLAAELEAGAHELAGLKAAVGKAGNVRERLAELQARLKAIQFLTDDQDRPLRTIDAFADAVPADVWITALEDKDAMLRISGSAFSATPVANFMAALRASGRFKDVDIVISRRDLAKTPNVVSFEVTCWFGG